MMWTSSTKTVSRLRNSARTTARPTATSPAATAIVKTANTWPIRSWVLAPKAMKLMLAAFIISSIDMRMTMALRRVRTPRTPMVNSTRLKIRASTGGIGTAGPSVFLARQDDRADHRHEQEHGGDLEGQQVVLIERPADLLQVYPLGREVHRRAERGRKAAAGRDVDEQPRRRQAHQRRDGGVHPHARSDPGAEIHQHDDEQEQDEDPARVHQHLDRGHELGPQQDVDPGHAQEREDEIDGRMDDVAAPDHHQGRQDRYGGQDVEHQRRGRHAYSL